MRSRFMRSEYFNIHNLQRRQSIRLVGAAGICLALVLTAACGGGGSDSNSDPTDPGPGDGNPGDGNPGDGNDGGGGDDGTDVSEIPLDELRDHLHSVPEDKRPPKFDQWERNMTEDGSTIGQLLQSNASFTERRKAIYYDSQRVFLQIREYLGRHQPWSDYAETAGDIYRRYVDKHDGQLAGYWRFSHGVLMDYQLNGDEGARDYVVTLRDEPTFSDPTRGIADSWDQATVSREIAYALQAQMVAEKAGEPRQQEKVERFVDLALGHIDIWLTGKYIAHDPSEHSVQAFMIGLSASALIEYYERSVDLGEPDERIPPKLRALADWLWKEMWVPGADGSEFGAFEHRQYPDGSDSGPSGDLNMLIAPMYGWLYKETGANRFLERGDQVFGGGVELAWLEGGKQFDQNYRDSFDFLRWRQEGLDRYGY